jgi:hypothetical protein
MFVCLLEFGQKSVVGGGGDLRFFRTWKGSRVSGSLCNDYVVGYAIEESRVDSWQGQEVPPLPFTRESGPALGPTSLLSSE